MNSPRWLPWAALIATLSATPGFAHETKTHVVATVHLATLEKYRSDQVKSTLAGTPEILSTYYGDSLRLMTEAQKTVLGKTNALSYHQAFSARFVVKEYSRNKMEILDLGSQVIEIGLFTSKITLKSTGKEHDLAGKYLDVWEKDASGELRLITAVWNYDHQVSFTDDLRFDGVPSVQMAFQARLPVQDNLSFELAGLNHLLETAISQHDARIWAQFFTEDALLLANHSPLVRGRAAMNGYIAEHVKALPVFEKLDIRNDRIDDLGNYVIEYATHVANWRNGDWSGVNTGKNLRIWRREPDCALKLFLQIGMYD